MTTHAIAACSERSRRQNNRGPKRAGQLARFGESSPLRSKRPKKTLVKLNDP